MLGNQSKNKPVGLHQAIKLLHSKETNEHSENTYKKGEHICILYIWQWVTIQNIKGTPTTQ